MDQTSRESRPEAADPITRQKLSDQVFDRLWKMIVSGDLAPGDAIPSERALMDRFGVGRPAVREALQALAGKGVITISQGERSRVNELSAAIAVSQVDEIAKLMLSAEPSNLDHLKEVRKVLEAGVARLAAGACTPEDASALRDLIAKQAAQQGDAKGFSLADIEFHVGVAKLTRNPLLLAIMRAMLNWLLEYYTPVLHWPGREDATLREHEKLVDYLEAHDAQSAQVLMRQHLDRSDPLFVSKKR
ncbi:MAG: transcriptional regulator NanR [Pseudomonadota bacterium]